jgi:hypothetical protein
VSTTYGIDKFPLRAGPLICVGRGIISFGLSDAVSVRPSVAALNLSSIMNTLGESVAGITVLTYFLGLYPRKVGRVYNGFGESKTDPALHRHEE